MFQNKEAAAILVYLATRPPRPGIKIYFYAKVVFCFSTQSNANATFAFVIVLCINKSLLLFTSVYLFSYEFVEFNRNDRS